MAGGADTAGDLGSAPVLVPRDRLKAWRDRLLASPRFHRWAARFPLTRPIARRRSRDLFDLCAGFVYSQVLAACVELRLFETLAAGPRSSADLSRHLTLPLDATQRLLRAATSLRLLEKRGPDRFGLGMLGAATLGNPGIAAMVAHHAMLYRDLADPVAFLRRERGGAALAGFWPYATPGASIDEADVAPYTRLMSVSQSFVAEQVLDAYPVTRHRRLLDIGGGDGTFLAAAARRAPTLDLILFDLPAVANLARIRFRREGLDERAIAIGGSFFEDPLPDGCDLATLVRVVHDHDDGPALALLRRARAALSENGTLLIAEPLADTPGAEPMGEAYFGFYLAAMGSGRARSREELAALVTQAGFAAVQSLPTANPMLVSLLSAKVAK